MRSRRATPAAPPVPSAFAIAMREARCDLGVFQVDAARLVGVPLEEWVAAEDGLRTLERSAWLLGQLRAALARAA